MPRKPHHADLFNGARRAGDGVSPAAVAVVVAQPVRIGVARSGSATSLASRRDEVECMGRRLGPAGSARPPLARRLGDREQQPSQRRQGREPAHA